MTNEKPVKTQRSESLAILGMIEMGINGLQGIKKKKITLFGWIVRRLDPKRKPNQARTEGEHKE